MIRGLGVWSWFTDGYLDWQETSSIARQEVNKMKALAVLTMVFLPATFVAVSSILSYFPRELWLTLYR